MKKVKSAVSSKAASRRENQLGPLDQSLKGWLEFRGGRQGEHLQQLWRNWDMVMGSELSRMALPLGHREGILLVGAEDHFVLQELSYAVPEILERSNAFMGQELFLKVELSLLQGRTPLNQIRLADYPPPPPPEKPKKLGGLMGMLDPNSPIGRCYAAYVRMFESLEKAEGSAKNKQG